MIDAYLREAMENDMDLLFQWVNEPAVRESAFSTGEILYFEHQVWYSKILRDANCKQYIYIYKENAIGQARITVYGNEAEIDYSICKEARGLGHGRNLLNLLCEQVRLDFPNVEKLVAKVKPDNIASRQVFSHMGFTEKFSFFELDVQRGKLF